MYNDIIANMYTIFHIFLFFFRILFLFHKNDGQYFKAKVRPPRLDGEKVGLFASRSPHRPNPIGLSLVQLEHIDGTQLFFTIVLDDNLIIFNVDRRKINGIRC